MSDAAGVCGVFPAGRFPPSASPHASPLSWRGGRFGQRLRVPSLQNTEDRTQEHSEAPYSRVSSRSGGAEAKHTVHGKKCSRTFCVHRIRLGKLGT